MGMRGWTGGDDGTKVMMFEVDMPHCGEESCDFDRPAVWALNARVSAAEGCTTVSVPLIQVEALFACVCRESFTGREGSIIQQEPLPRPKPKKRFAHHPVS